MLPKIKNRPIIKRHEYTLEPPDGDWGWEGTIENSLIELQKK